jgi:hypothetical protein
LPGIPEIEASDTVAAPLAWLVVALLDGAAAAGLLAGLDVAVLDVDVLEPLEQAAASRPIPATPAALAIHRVNSIMNGAAAAGTAGMHHAPFGQNYRQDRRGAVPWLPGPTGGQA